MITNLYSGDFYIIKNVVSKKYIEKLKLNLTKFSQKNQSSFYKIYNGCPNYWRRQDEEIAKKYSVKAVRDSYYFFRWNKEKFKVWKKLDKIWSHIKFLGGLNHDEFKKNVPKDIIVDRIQVVRYPENSGYVEPHFHNPKNQRIIISLYMSKLGKDYSDGGTCFFRKKTKVKVEPKIDIGDVGIFYATLKHAVDPITIKMNSKLKSELIKGRWWCGLYSPESDYNKKRHTSSPTN